MSELFDRIVAIGGSAGGIEPVIEVLRKLPAGFAAPVVIAVHGGPQSRLPEVLARDCALDVVVAENAVQLRPGAVHVCPGAHHVYVKQGFVRVTAAPAGTRFRPSVDMLFQSLALEYGSRAIAVVLSGELNDGTIGAQILHDEGALTLVQSPDEARFTSMPNSVIRHDHPEHVLTADDIAKRLIDLVGTV